MDSTTLPRLLHSQLQRLVDGGAEERSVVATGLPHLDALLPGGGLPQGALTELLGGGAGGASPVDVRLEGSGAWTFAAHLVCQALRRRGLEERSRFAVWVDGAGGLHPPALFALGVPPERFLLTRPSSAADALWAFDQALRCRQVAVAVADLTRLEMPHLRRLQLAAREGGGLAILLRPAAEARNPSAAAARLGVRPLASVNSAVKPVNGPATADPMDVRLFAFAVEVLRARGGWGGGGVRVNVQWNVEHPHGAAAHPLHCVSTPLE